MKSESQESMVDNSESLSYPELSLMALWGTIFIGLSLTTVLYFNFVKVDNDQVKSHLQRASQVLSQYSEQTALNPIFESVFSVLYGVQTDFEGNKGSIPELLESYLWSPAPLGLETTTLEFLPRVDSDKLGEYGAMFNHHENTSFPIVEEVDSRFVPAGLRNEYYPVLFEASYAETMATIGLDRRNDETFNIVMQQARDTGEISSRSTFPIAGTEGEYVQNHYYLAIYESGTENTTIAQRRENHIGFISAVSYTPKAAALDLMPESLAGIEAVFISRSEAYGYEPHNEAVQSLFNNGLMVEANYAIEGEPFVVVSKASNALVAAMVTDKRWWALGLGFLLTSWAAAMILWSRRQSKNIITLVHERTRDLQERTNLLRQANEALSISESRYRMLADNATDVIYTHDMSGICTYISPSIKHHNGFDVDDYIGLPITNLLNRKSTEIVETNLKLARQDFLKDPEAKEKYYTFDYESYSKDRIRKYVENTISFLFDEDGNPVGMLGVSRDITKRKEAERGKEALEGAYRQSQKMEAIGTLAGGIAHDFNNLLTGILGHSDMLKLQVKGDQKAERSVGVIETAALRAKDLTNQLLGFARKGQYQEALLDLNEVLLDIIKLIERTVDKKIEIKHSLNTEVPIVNGDLGQITQLFLNLAVNAKDALPDGGKIIFETQVVDLDAGFCQAHLGAEPGKYNLIMVSDTGVGISVEKMDRIFEPFFTDKDNGKGTGLGLAMVYGVTKNHGGVVDVYSVEGEGTTFKVYLPFTEGRIEKNLKDKSETLIKGEGTILIVDDELMIRDMAESMLKRLGYDVLLAEDGIKGLEVYRSNWGKVDLVIVDMIMPNMGGVDCLRGLNKINPNVKAILSTGFSHDAMMEKLGEDDFVSFLQKPFRLQEFSEVVSRAISYPLVRQKDVNMSLPSRF